MAEIELSIFSKQCLRRRIGDEQTLRQEIEALERESNEAGALIDWRFTTKYARNKLRQSTQHNYVVVVLDVSMWSGSRLGSGGNCKGERSDSSFDH